MLTFVYIKIINSKSLLETGISRRMSDLLFFLLKMLFLSKKVLMVHAKLTPMQGCELTTKSGHEMTQDLHQNDRWQMV